MVLRYVTDQGANIVAGLKPYTILHPVPSTHQELFDDAEFPYLAEECEEGRDSQDNEIDQDNSDEDDDDEDENDDNDIDDCDEIEVREVMETGHGVANPHSNDYVEEVDEVDAYERFPKRLNCLAHVLNTMCHAVLDKNNNAISKLKKKVLPLINKFSKSGVATEDLKYLAGKKLLKVAATRWNSFFYVCNRLAKLRTDVMKVCSERKWDILFVWSDVEGCRDFLKPIAIASTFLEGQNYSTVSGIIPCLLSVQEHLINMQQEPKFKKFKTAAKQLQDEFNRRFGFIIDPNSDNFDQTYLVSTMLHPEKSAELYEELFGIGKLRVTFFLMSSITIKDFEVDVLDELALAGSQSQNVDVNADFAENTENSDIQVYLN